VSELRADPLPPSAVGHGGEAAAYATLLDPKRIQALEKAIPNSGLLVLGLVKADQEHLAALQVTEAERDHHVRILTIWLTVLVILAITGASVWVILAGFQVAGSILATCDLVALANVFINSIRRR
jgi:hypothetical protein